MNVHVSSKLPLFGGGRMTAASLAIPVLRTGLTVHVPFPRHTVDDSGGPTPMYRRGFFVPIQMRGLIHRSAYNSPSIQLPGQLGGGGAVSIAQGHLGERPRRNHCDAYVRPWWFQNRWHMKAQSPRWVDYMDRHLQDILGCQCHRTSENHCN